MIDHGAFEGYHGRVVDHLRRIAEAPRVHPTARQLASKLTNVDQVEFWSAVVAWIFVEERQDPRQDPIPPWLAWYPARQLRFNSARLTAFLIHLVTGLPARNTRRDARAVARILLSTRFSPTVLSVATRLAERVRGRTLEGLVEITRAERERAAVRARAEAQQAAPYGVNADKTIDIFRDPDRFKETG